jgi:hypothetical protein
MALCGKRFQCIAHDRSSYLDEYQLPYNEILKPPSTCRKASVKERRVSFPARSDNPRHLLAKLPKGKEAGKNRFIALR